jgi:biopolymer transport protein ExbD
MRFHFSNTRKPITEFSMASMTDMVLLLLIFFLLSSSFIPQFGIQVNLPQADTSVPTEDQYVSVSITAEGHYYVNQTQVPPEALLDTIQEAKGDRAALVLRADEEATVGQFALVANYAKALGLRVLMATERGTNPIGQMP